MKHYCFTCTKPYRLRTLSLLLLLSLLTACVPPVAPQVVNFTKIHPLLRAIAAEQPEAWMHVIVQKSVKDHSVEAQVDGLGGRVLKDLPFINAFTAQLPASAISALAQTSGVRYISIDSAMLSTSTQPTASAGGTYRDLSAASMVINSQAMRDEFNTVAFNNNNGNQNWAGAWIENDTEAGGAGPTVGQVRIVNGQLRLDDTPDTYGQPSIARQANLANVTSATLSFDFQTAAGVDYDDAVRVEISGDGGNSYTTLETFTGIVGSSMGARSYNILPYATMNTTVRFQVTNKYGASDEFFFVDNVQIAYATAGSNTDSNPTPSNSAPRYVRLVATSEINDNPWTAVAELNVLDATGNPLPKTNWRIVSVDSEETVGEDGRAINAIDGNPATFWMTAWNNTSPTHPHEIVVDLGNGYNLSGFRYLARQDGWENGNIANYNFYVSSDGVTWGVPLASGRLLNTQSEQTVHFGSSQPDAAPISIAWATALGTVSDIKMVDARYLVDEIGFGPDGYYGYHVGNGKAAFTGFDVTAVPGHAITKVEAVFPAFINQAFSKDFKIKTYIAGKKQGEIKVKTDIFYNAIGAGNAKLIAVDITDTYDWTWAAFHNDLQLSVETGGLGGDHAIYYDAVGLRVTSAAGNDASANNPPPSVALPKQAIDTSNLVNSFPFAVRAPEVWNDGPHYHQGQAGTIAVVDSGISKTEDLKGRNVKDVNFNRGYQNSTDLYGHGTFVASMIAGDGKKSDGAFMGIAPKSRLLNVRVSDDQGMAYESDVIAALQWIYENKDDFDIRVVNLSLNSSVVTSYHLSPLNAAVEVLWFNGVVVVVAAGNNGTADLFPPANDPFVITVGATDDKGTWSIADDTIGSFSAYGTTTDGFTKPDLVAPGKDIVMYLPKNEKLGMGKKHSSQSIDKDYFRMSGTSLAAPIVAGAVAILLQDEPQLTPDQVKYRLMATANKNWAGYDIIRAGAGYLDIYAAVNGTTTASANSGIAASQLLWTGPEPVTWGSVSWNSVSWNSVSWNSVSWNSVSWNSVSWNSDHWEMEEVGAASAPATLRPYDIQQLPAPINVGQDEQREEQGHRLYLPVVTR